MKECGRKDSKIAGTAATNLSFIYFLVSTYIHAVYIYMYIYNNIYIYMCVCVYMIPLYYIIGR